MTTFTWGYGGVCEMCNKKRRLWKCETSGGVVYACKKCSEDFIYVKNETNRIVEKGSW